MPSKKIVNSKLKIANSKTAKPVRKTATKTVRGALTAPMYDAKGAKHGAFALPKEIFGAKINQPLMAQAVRVYLANQRTGSANTKTRGEVTLTSAKWYRQKGTGRARHGAKSAPIFMGGGVAHGPRVRDFSLSLPQKMRKAALISALSLKASVGEIKVLSGLTKIEPKTKVMATALKKITDDKTGKAKILLVTSDVPKNLEHVYRAGRNIKNIELINAKMLNTYEVLKYKNLFFMKESFEVLAASTSNVAAANAVKRN